MEDNHENQHRCGPIRGHRSPRWGELSRIIGEWWQHQRSLHELESLDDVILRDIGLSRDESRFETSKPFWMN